MNFIGTAAVHGIGLIRLQDRKDLAFLALFRTGLVGKGQRLDRLVAVDLIPQDIDHVVIVGKIKRIP